MEMYCYLLGATGYYGRGDWDGAGAAVVPPALHRSFRQDEIAGCGSFSGRKSDERRRVRALLSDGADQRASAQLRSAFHGDVLFAVLPA